MSESKIIVYKTNCGNPNHFIEVFDRSQPMRSYYIDSDRLIVPMNNFVISGLDQVYRKKTEEGMIIWVHRLNSFIIAAVIGESKLEIFSTAIKDFRDMLQIVENFQPVK
jgi:hypothetical protein